MPADELHNVPRPNGPEIASVHRDSSLSLERQPRRSADHDGDLVPSGQRLTKHVAAEGSRSAKDDETRHVVSGAPIGNRRHDQRGLTAGGSAATAAQPPASAAAAG